MNNLNDTEIILKENYLEGKRISFCVGGSIAAMETIKIVRELRRYGASVTVYLTKTALRFITPLALEWASGNQVVSKFGGLAKHIFVDDILVVAPATANLINSVTSGLGAGVVSCLIASALGVKKDKKNLPIIFFSAMHQSLYLNPFFSKSLNILKNHKVKIFTSKPEEGKIKLPSIEEVISKIIRSDQLENNTKLKNKKVLLTGGTVPSYLDSVRYISNEATGRTAIIIAQEIYLMGGNPILLLHESVSDIPPYLKNNIVIERFKDFITYQEKVFNLVENLTLAIFTAGVSDFTSNNFFESKKSSKYDWTIKLVPNEKVIQKIKNKFPKLKTIVFKLKSQVEPVELFTEMNNLLLKGHDFVFGNILEDLTNRVEANKIKRFFVANEENINKDNIQKKILEINSQKELALKVIELLQKL